MWFIVQRRRRRPSSVTKHYLTHKKAAREHVLARLEYWNQYYGFTYKRVAIRNQRRCWGSCSELGNLNFSYKLLFLPPCLADYIIVHELCHLDELNHGRKFWSLVGAAMPDYKERRSALRQIERTIGSGVVNLERVKQSHRCALCEGQPSEYHRAAVFMTPESE